jgi:hypothetical protein
MAGEVMLINPRHKRRRTKRARAHSRPRRVRRVRRRGFALAMNPRRRRQVARRTHRRGRRARVHRNPRLPFGLGSFPMMTIGIGAVGMVGTYVLGKKIASMIPPEWNVDPTLARVGSKALVGIVGPQLLRRWIGGKTANALAIGGGIAVALDLLSTAVPKDWGFPSLADYETGVLSDYQQGVLSGYGHGLDAVSLAGDSAYGNGAY